MNFSMFAIPKAHVGVFEICVVYSQMSTRRLVMRKPIIKSVYKIVSSSELRFFSGNELVVMREISLLAIG